MSRLGTKSTIRKPSRISMNLYGAEVHASEPPSSIVKIDHIRSNLISLIIYLQGKKKKKKKRCQIKLSPNTFA